MPCFSCNYTYGSLSPLGSIGVNLFRRQENHYKVAEAGEEEGQVLVLFYHLLEAGQQEQHPLPSFFISGFGSLISKAGYSGSSSAYNLFN